MSAEQRKWGFRLAKVLVPLVVLVLLALRIPNFLTLRNLMNVIRQGSIIAIPAIVVTMALITRGIDLSTSGVIAFAPMLCIVLYKMGLPIALCMLVALAAGTLLGCTNGLIIAKVGVTPFIATFVMGNILIGFSLVMSSGGALSGFPRGFTKIGNGELFGVIPYSNLIMVACVAAGAVFLAKTQFGNWIYAYGNNPQVLKMAGVNIDLINIVIYALSGFFCAITGLLLSSQLASVHPLQGSSYQTDCIAACILGGTSMLGGEGTVVKSAVGAIVIAVLRNVLNLLGVKPFMQSLLLGIIMICIVAISMLMKQREEKRALAHWAYENRGGV